MTTATNEPYIGWIHENCYLMGAVNDTFERGECKLGEMNFMVREWVDF